MEIGDTGRWHYAFFCCPRISKVFQTILRRFPCESALLLPAVHNDAYVEYKRSYAQHHGSREHLERDFRQVCHRHICGVKGAHALLAPRRCSTPPALCPSSHICATHGMCSSRRGPVQHGTPCAVFEATHPPFPLQEAACPPTALCGVAGWLFRTPAPIRRAHGGTAVSFCCPRISKVFQTILRRFPCESALLLPAVHNKN